MILDWPRENAVDKDSASNRWFHPSSNYCLDFHGDPVTSELTVFSDGNHHMALEQALEQFRSQKKFQSIFYCTTPPKVYLDWINAGSIEIGNLRISSKPDVVIGPDDIMDKLTKDGVVLKSSIFAKSRGISLIVAKNNPKSIFDVEDILKQDVQVFLSNPVTEKASHCVYRDALEARCREKKMEEGTISAWLKKKRGVVYGELIHHREAPQSIVNGIADVAIVYHHLALRYTRIFPDHFEQIPLPGIGQKISTHYAVGITNQGSASAEELYSFFLSEDAKDIYTHHGLAQN
ncbi:MAG: substrate-binding domain-containing protein [Gammaproteobacteria bacterium]|nr:substrate-binding domain-containing protein [Gammaproteobacteria bacterium]